jgi:glycosyltransferase involved in cell wall biosynthesis
MYPKRTKLLFVIPSLSGGGAERVVATLLGAMDPQRFELSLVLLGSSDATPEILPDHVQVYDLGGRRLRTALWLIIRFIHLTRPDVVMSTLDHLNVALCISRPAWPSRSRLVVRATDLMNLDNSKMSLAMRFSYRLADGIIYQSAAMRDAFVERLGLSHKPARVINNPVMLEAVFRLADEPPSDPAALEGEVLVCAGRLVHAKGFDLMLDALAMMDNHDLRVIVLGTGEDHELLESRRDRLGLTSRVRFLGFQKNPYAYFSRARGFLLSSRYEGFPNVVLEALACGAPVVAAPVPGVSDLLDNVPGCVVASSHSAEDLSKAMTAFLNNPRGKIPRETIVPYAANRVSQDYGDFFEFIAHQSTNRRSPSDSGTFGA